MFDTEDIVVVEDVEEESIEDVSGRVNILHVKLVREEYQERESSNVL